jgi:O-succinylbenzoic acid--CoA ligase
MERTQLIEILRATGCAEEYAGFTFLCDPKWGAGERAALALAAEQSKIKNQKSKIALGWLCLPTGGTSGGIRFARHDELTLTEAVRGFCAHFEIRRVNVVDVLPPYHVSGLMARVRCAETGGEYRSADWKLLEAGKFPELGDRPDGWVISLVPTQLHRLLGSADAIVWLKKFRVILIGGGPIWASLAEASAKQQLPLVLSYGMTETAAMVAAQRPGEFLAGARDCGVALPHARLRLEVTGVVAVSGDSLFRGYFPHEREPGPFTTEDLGELDAHGRLRILGRRDAVIITGGKKVHPSEVEAALHASGEFADVVVLGLPDPEWGEAVVAFYPDNGAHAPDLERAARGLAGYQQPKRFVAVRDWPRNAQGKVNRAALRAEGWKGV